jgi:hypothetical protein
MLKFTFLNALREAAARHLHHAVNGSFGPRASLDTKGGDLNWSTQHTLRTSLLASDIARSCEAVH